MNDIIIFCGTYLYLFVIMGCLYAWKKTDRSLQVQFIIAFMFGSVIAYLIAAIASKLFYDPRPFVVMHVKPLIAHAADNGFPSDHALLTMTLTALTFFYNRRLAIVMAILTFFVGVGRVLAHIHSPIDILAGWIIGAAGAWVGYELARFIWRKYGGKHKKNDVSQAQ